MTLAISLIKEILGSFITFYTLIKIIASETVRNRAWVTKVVSKVEKVAV